MKNTLKILAIILAILAVILLCYFSFRAGWNARENSDEYESFVVKTFYSYEDAVRVCGIAGLENQYTVDYKADDFTVFYQFVKPHCTTKYPIDYDTFIEKISEKGLKDLSTYIFFDESVCSGHADSGHPYMSDLTIYEGDEDYDKLMENTVRPWLVLNSGLNTRELEDRSLLSYTTYSNDDGLFGGTIYYDGTEIIEFFSCFEPDEALMKTIFDCLVNVPDKSEGGEKLLLEQKWNGLVVNKGAKTAYYKSDITVDYTEIEEYHNQATEFDIIYDGSVE